MIGAVVLLLSIGLWCTRHPATAIWICAGQALCAAAAFGLTGSPAALVALALNAIAMPVALWRIADRDTAMPPNAWSSWLVAVALLVVAAAAFRQPGDGLALGVSVILLGLLLAARGVPAFGLLSAQNGLVMVASAIPGLSLVSGLVVAVPLVPAIMLAGMAMNRPRIINHPVVPP